MSDDEDDLIKQRRVLEIFRRYYKLDSVQNHHQTYIDDLHERLQQWKHEIDVQIKRFFDEKIEEIDQLYEQYCEEFNDKYSQIKQQLELDDTSTNIDNQIENFQHFCQINTIENCLHLKSKIFSNEQLNENIQIEYILHSDQLPIITNEIFDEQKSLRSPIESLTKIIKENIIEQLNSSDEDKTIESPQSIIKQRSIQSSSPILEHAIESLTRQRSIESINSPNLEQTIRSTQPIVRKRLLQSPVEQKQIEPFQTLIESSSENILHSSPIQPIQLIVRNRTESISSARTSSISSLISNRNQSRQFSHSNSFEIQRLSNRLQHYSPIHQINNNQRKNLTRLYIGNHDVLTPVLVGKNRDVYNQNERIIEYSIDSISIPQDKQQISTESDDEMMIVRAYKVLIREENDYQSLSSDHDIDDDDLSNLNEKFSLKKFDQINYSTILFHKCETEYNCLSSSQKRNELILYNSKLNILIVLQHENHYQCRSRFYLHWPKILSSTISDITYCQDIDYFLISTRNTSRIYLFDRHLFSIIDLGQLSNDAPLRRIHSYHQTIYCILGNNYLLEYQFNENYSQINIIRKIKLFNPFDLSQDTHYHLLDITADDIYLIVIYGNEHDEIRLQSIYRETRKFHRDILIDKQQPINQNYIRIESTYFNGQFLYLNGSQQYLKSIDLINYNQGKITAIMRRHTKPTNISFLADQRLVILYEEPYFLSVHDYINRQHNN